MPIGGFLGIPDLDRPIDLAGLSWSEQLRRYVPKVQDVATIAALKSLPPGGRWGNVSVECYATQGDGGGAWYRWNATDATADNGGTVVAPSVGGTGRWNRVGGFETFLNVKGFGAVGDGTTNDTAAIQAALNTGRTVYIPGGYTFLVTGLTTATCPLLFGDGKGSTIKSATDAAILVVSNDEQVVNGVRFLGDGKGASYDGGKTSQHGVSINDKYRVRVTNCAFETVGGGGVYSTLTVDDHSGNSVIGCSFYNCNKGIFTDTQGEYLTVTACSFQSCHWGIYNGAGNLVGAACRLNDCKIGIELHSGTNDAHGVLSASQINHSVDFGIKADGILLGFIFSGCAIYASDIWLKSCYGVKLLDGQIDSANFYFQGSLGTVIRGNLMPHAYANTINDNYSAAQSRTQWAENYGLNGAIYPSASANTGIRGGYAKATFNATQTIATAGAATLIAQVLSANYHCGNTSYTADTFYAVANGKFTAKGYGGNKATIRATIKTTIAGATKDNVYIEVRLNGVFRDYMRAQLLAGYYFFTYDLDIPVKAADEITFYLQNTSGGDTVVQTADTFIEVEGL